MLKKIVVASFVIAVVVCLAFLIREAGNSTEPKAPECSTQPEPSGTPSVSEEQSVGNAVEAAKSAGPSSEAAVTIQPGQPGIFQVPDGAKKRRLKVTDKPEMPGEIEIGGKKFKLVGKHKIDLQQVELEREGKTVTAKFPIPEEAKKKQKDKSKEGGKKEGDEK